MLKQTLLFILCFTLIGVISSGSVFAQEVLKQDKMKKHSHEVSVDSAKKYINNLKKDAMQMRTKGGVFSRDVLDKILAQKDCIGIRYYYAKMDDGTPTLVIVGVDTAGRDMTKATVAEKVFPCPPYCDESTSLNR